MKSSRTIKLFAIISIATLGVLAPRLATSARADGGTLTLSSTSLSYTQGPFLIPNQSDSATTPVCGPQLCGLYSLTVDVPAGTEQSKMVRVQVGWDMSYATTAQFDVWVVDANGNPIDAQEILGADPAVTEFPAKAGSYTIEVVPDTPLGLSVQAYVDLVSIPSGPSPNAAPAYSGIYPRYQNYAVPQSMGGNGGEPSIGTDWLSGKALFQSILQTLKINFDDSTSPANATWTDVSAPSAQESLDPILFSDHNTNRVFETQLTGQDSLTEFSDNDGYSWTPSQGGGIPSGVDHETVGGGPYSVNATITPPTTGGITGYKDAVYYCSQDLVTAFCARSDNGGLTFGPGIPIYAQNTCAGIHGHVKVAPDGTVYVPNGNCGGKQGVAVSTDNGQTWTVRTVPDSTPYTGNDPSVGIATDGTIYFGYQGTDGHAHIAVSHDRGLTWSKSADVSGQLGVQNIVFPAVVAGDPNRAAFAYLGTTTGGNYQQFGVFQGVWHLYISTTYDGGKTWATVDATPNDPVQRGTICTSGTLVCANTPDDRNLLDFIDVTIDKTGRVLVGYADGCINSCVTADPSAPANSTNSFTALATIARQSGGKGLFAAYDTPEPAVPARPPLTVTAGAGTASLAWQPPDDGGSAITSYNVFRGTSPGAETLLASPGADQTRYDDTGLTPGTTYYYQVQACNAIGCGPRSPEASS